MFEKIKTTLLYAGVDRFNYERVIPTIQKVNRIMITTLTAFSMVLIGIMILISNQSTSLSNNILVYELGFVLSLIFFVISLTVAKKKIKIVPILVYASISIYYIYGLLIGTTTNPDQNAVTFMVFLVFLPILFIDKPIHSICITTLYVSIFIILCFYYKNENILIDDVIDAIMFGLLGVASGTITNTMKVKGYVLENKLKEISKTDQLTQMKNRNAYELEYDSIPQKCKHTLACLYIDANSLHEINNEKGHEYGDKMLKYIAMEIMNTFSDEYSYRTGGDEFITFITDTSKEKIEALLLDMTNRIKSEGYNIAAGFEISKIKYLSLDDLIKSAESKMFKDKMNFYKNIKNREIRNLSRSQI